jgi:hypothetical protein
MASELNAVGFSGVWSSGEGSCEVILAFQTTLTVNGVQQYNKGCCCE